MADRMPDVLLGVPRAYRGLATTVLIIALAIIGSFDPVTTVWYPRCPFLVLSGLYCPGCGSLRALHHLLSGDPMAVFRLNALAGLYLLLAPVLMLRPAMIGSVLLARLTLGVIVGFWFLRNLPLAPFLALAPEGLPAPLFR